MREIPELSEAKIVGWVGEAFAQRGEDYFKRGKVLEFIELDDVTGVDSRVDGTAARPYKVTIEFGSRGGLKSRCTCPTGKRCKHVAATLYEILHDQQGKVESDEEELETNSFSMWLGGMTKAIGGRKTPLIYPDHVKQRLLYILEPQSHSRHISLRFLTTRILRDGSYGKANNYQASNILGHNIPQYILSSDEYILRAVATDSSLAISARNYALKGEEGLALLRRLLATERCHWLDLHTPALKLAEKRTADWFWETDKQGAQSLQLALPALGDGDESQDQKSTSADLSRYKAGHVVVTSPPWYIDSKHYVAGPIESGQLPDVAELLLNMPKLALDCSDEALQAIAEELPKGIVMPKRLKHQRRTVMPVPVIQLLSKELMLDSVRAEKRHIVALMFDYDGHTLAFGKSEKAVFRTVSHGLVADFERDMEAEARAVSSLYDAGLHVMSDDYLARNRKYIEKHYFTLHDRNYWPEWVLHEVPVLKEKGFHVEVSPDFSYRMETAKTWQLDMAGAAQGSNLMGQTSFSVTLDDGESIDLIEVLGRWVGQHPDLLQESSLLELKAKETLALPLLDGRMLAAPGEMIANILHYMLDVFASNKPKEMMLSAPQMLALEDSMKESSTPVQVSSSVWLQHMKKLSNLQSIPECVPPTSLQAELRDYQCEGLSWLQFLREMQLNAILADDMGLGKTVQALSHILTEKEQGRLVHPALVIAPTSLMYNWRREAEKFTPTLKVLVLHGSERAQHFAHLRNYDLILTTYPLLVRDFEVLQVQPWHLLVLDEAQYIKNPRSKMAQQVRKLEASHKLCMTGTPMENHLGELWAQFDFLMPGYLYDQRNFTQLFRKPIEKEGDVARQEALNLRIRPFLLRRTKEEVAAELPPKTEMIRSTDLSDQQREMYESVRLAMQKKVRDAVATLGVDKSQIIVLDALLKMRQVCCDPRLVKGVGDNVPASAKLEMLREMLVEMLEEGRRILLFSQFTGMLKLIEEELKILHIDYVILTGKTKDRETPVNRFQNGEVPLFLISLKAGGVGLNLTAADTVIHYDPWWNPAVERQATDRAHRIGQEKSVFVYKLITEGTVEEKILELQERKRELAEGVYQKGKASRQLWTADDMDALFAPLN
ncbi:MAG: DEAD/DEAH box helicase [Mariprofundaceae bacterium]|nr:DEAD/DEAH box helicase [Mariprofundaceae bacterium]